MGYVGSLEGNSRWGIPWGETTDPTGIRSPLIQHFQPGHSKKPHGHPVVLAHLVGYLDHQIPKVFSYLWTPFKKTHGKNAGLVQGGPLPVIHGLITPINSLIIGFSWSYFPLVIGVITQVIFGRGPTLWVSHVFFRNTKTNQLQEAILSGFWGTWGDSEKVCWARKPTGENWELPFQWMGRYLYLYICNKHIYVYIYIDTLWGTHLSHLGEVRKIIDSILTFQKIC